MDNGNILTLAHCPYCGSEWRDDYDPTETHVLQVLDRRTGRVSSLVCPNCQYVWLTDKSGKGRV